MKQTILILFVGLLVGQAAANAADKNTKVLYDFEKDDLGGWFDFNNNVDVTLKLLKERGKGVMEIDYKYGADSFLGVGVKPTHVLDKDPKAWFKYSKGALLLTVRADKKQELGLELRMVDGAKYIAKVAISNRMKSYRIPFADFKNGGKSLDLSDKEVEQIILTPARGENKSHKIMVDEVAISTKK